MKNLNKSWTAITLALGIPAFLLGRVIWPDPTGFMLPPANLLPFYVFISLLEGLAFGFGVGFLIYGRRIVTQVPKDSKRWTTAAYLSISWLLISWWPHDNWHRANGMDLVGLIKIEYCFHFTLIIAATILSLYFLKQTKKK